MYVILVYDICLDDKEGKRVLRKIYRIAKKYLIHIQNSVFEGELSAVQTEALKAELKKYLRSSDSCIVFTSRNARWLEKTFLTKFVDHTSNII